MRLFLHKIQNTVVDWCAWHCLFQKNVYTHGCDIIKRKSFTKFNSVTPNQCSVIVLFALHDNSASKQVTNSLAAVLNKEHSNKINIIRFKVHEKFRTRRINWRKIRSEKHEFRPQSCSIVSFNISWDRKGNFFFAKRCLAIDNKSLRRIGG